MLELAAHRQLRLIFGPPAKAPPTMRSSAAATLPFVAGFRGARTIFIAGVVVAVFAEFSS